jgi:tetratricopeptide (TPR) repeat protein
MRGWVAGALIGSAICATAAAVAFAVHERDRLTSFTTDAVGKLLGRSFRAPPRPVAHRLPPLPVPTALPFVGPEGNDADGYPRKTPSILGLRALLVAKRFDDLTRYAEELEDEAERNFKREYWALDSMRGFLIADPALEPLLDEWIEHSPRSFAPYTARGMYRVELGWYERGTEYAKGTSAAQFKALAREAERAREDFRTALGLRPRALSPRLGVLFAARAGGDVRSELAGAIRDFPTSFLVRYYGMLGLTPRWGGSYAELERIAAEAAPLAGQNSRLLTLGGFADYARAQDLAGAEDYAGALPALDRAVSRGDFWLYLDERGRVKMHLKDYAGAALDLRQARALRPEIDDIQRHLANVSWQLKEYEEAGEAYLYAVRLDPTDFRDAHLYATAFEYAARARWNAGEPREALHDFDQALVLDPAYADVRRERGELLSHGDPNVDPAEVAALVTRAEAEDTFEAYLALDGALARRGRFAEVIRYWSAHLDRHPADGRGFVERGGAYTHVGRFDEALHDVNRACELGVPRGCELVPRVPALRQKYEEQRKR